MIRVAPVIIISLWFIRGRCWIVISPTNFPKSEFQWPNIRLLSLECWYGRVFLSLSPRDFFKYHVASERGLSWPSTDSLFFIIDKLPWTWQIVNIKQKRIGPRGEPLGMPEETCYHLISSKGHEVLRIVNTQQVQHITTWSKFPRRVLRP